MGFGFWVLLNPGVRIIPYKFGYWCLVASGILFITSIMWLPGLICLGIMASHGDLWGLITL